MPGKYKSKDPRPIHECYEKNYEICVLVQETEKSYLISSIHKNRNDEFDTKDAVWIKKSKIELGKKLGEIAYDGWRNNILDMVAFYKICTSYYNGISIVKSVIEGIPEKKKIVKLSQLNICKRCGCEDNKIRDDGLIKCKNCGIYYIL